jgi:hypothetical protein
MALYVVSFAEHGGYRYQCRIRAAAGADHVLLAVTKIWGTAAYWAWLPDSPTDGRVYECLGEEEAPTDIPRTGPTQVTIAPAHRRPRIAEGGTRRPCAASA